MVQVRNEYKVSVGGNYSFIESALELVRHHEVAEVRVHVNRELLTCGSVFGPKPVARAAQPLDLAAQFLGLRTVVIVLDHVWIDLDPARAPLNHWM